LFCGDADPRQAYDEKYLRKREIGKPEFFFEDGATSFNAVFLALELCRCGCVVYVCDVVPSLGSGRAAL
jgi:hypothetical protein